jgi:hypothetical protein
MEWARRREGGRGTEGRRERSLSIMKYPQETPGGIYTISKYLLCVLFISKLN